MRSSVTTNLLFAELSLILVASAWGVPTRLPVGVQQPWGTPPSHPPYTDTSSRGSPYQASMGPGSVPPSPHGIGSQGTMLSPPPSIYGNTFPPPQRVDSVGSYRSDSSGRSQTLQMSLDPQSHHGPGDDYEYHHFERYPDHVRARDPFCYIYTLKGSNLWVPIGTQKDKEGFLYYTLGAAPSAIDGRPGYEAYLSDQRNKKGESHREIFLPSEEWHRLCTIKGMTDPSQYPDGTRIDPETKLPLFPLIPSPYEHLPPGFVRNEVQRTPVAYMQKMNIIPRFLPTPQQFAAGIITDPDLGLHPGHINAALGNPPHGASPQSTGGWPQGAPYPQSHLHSTYTPPNPVGQLRPLSPMAFHQPPHSPMFHPAASSPGFVYRPSPLSPSGGRHAPARSPTTQSGWGLHAPGSNTYPASRKER